MTTLDWARFVDPLYTITEAVDHLCEHTLTVPTYPPIRSRTPYVSHPEGLPELRRLPRGCLAQDRDRADQGAQPLGGVPPG